MPTSTLSGEQGAHLGLVQEFAERPQVLDSQFVVGFGDGLKECLVDLVEFPRRALLECLLAPHTDRLLVRCFAVAVGDSVGALDAVAQVRDDLRDVFVNHGDSKMTDRDINLRNDAPVGQATFCRNHIIKGGVSA